jgi:hypothetical protein
MAYSQPLSLILVLVVLLPGSLSPQSLPPASRNAPPRPKVIARDRNSLTILVPTLVYLNADPAMADSATVELRKTADPLGFQVMTAAPLNLEIFDKRYAGIYYLPKNVREGYVVISPGKRPLVLSRDLSATDLRERLDAYRRH